MKPRSIDAKVPLIGNRRLGATSMTYLLQWPVLVFAAMMLAFGAVLIPLSILDQREN